MAQVLVSLALFSSVIGLAGATTITGLNYTADKVVMAVTSAPPKTFGVRKPNYIATMPSAQPKDLDIAKSVPVASSLSAEPDQLVEPPAPTFTHTVAVESLRVRAGPNKTTRQLFSLKGGTQVTVIREERGWLLVTAGGDRVGWVYNTLLRPAKSQAAQLR